MLTSKHYEIPIRSRVISVTQYFLFPCIWPAPLQHPRTVSLSSPPSMALARRRDCFREEESPQHPPLHSHSPRAGSQAQLHPPTSPYRPDRSSTLRTMAELHLHHTDHHPATSSPRYDSSCRRPSRCTAPPAIRIAHACTASRYLCHAQVASPPARWWGHDVHRWRQLGTAPASYCPGGVWLAGISTAVLLDLRQRELPCWLPALW